MSHEVNIYHKGTTERWIWGKWNLNRVLEEKYNCKSESGRNGSKEGIPGRKHQRVRGGKFYSENKFYLEKYGWS